ncbi:hypothetical protein J2N67_006225 (plasmid) [Bacillus thuringiensis]|nr:hypothetical protein J2N67_006225 [Bacillus thuringiensis]
MLLPEKIANMCKCVNVYLCTFTQIAQIAIYHYFAL